MMLVAYSAVAVCGVAGVLLHVWAWLRVSRQRQARFVASLWEFDSRGVFTRESAT